MFEINVPVDLVRVFHVSSHDTATPGLRQFVITATKVSRPDMGLQLQTVNPYAASVCQRAKDLNRAVAVTWERTAFGKTLQAAHLITSERTA